MSRDAIHQKIDELLGLISIHNSRLSLHTEKLSQLDIDVLRKQCIDLYDEINKLALQGKIKLRETKSKPVEAKLEEPPVAKPAAPAIEPEPTPEIVTLEATQPVDKPQDVAIPNKKRNPPPPKQEEEKLSLFEKFSSNPIESIAKGISVAKRFEFQSVFFEGDNTAYKEFMVKLDSASNQELAFEVYHSYKDKLGWENEELKDELKALMYRKFA